MLVIHNSPGDTGNPTFEPTETLQELPDNVLGVSECLAARFRMAGHYPDVLALADHAFRWAAKQDSKDLMVYVLEHGAPIDINALLSSADLKGNSEAIKLLIAKRAATEPWHILTYPLHTACYYGQLDVVNYMLKGVNSKDISTILRSKDYRGETALHKAIGGRGEKKDRERVSLVTKLLNLGADPIQRDKHGRTALILARESNHNEMIPPLKAAMMRKNYPPSTLREAFSEFEIMETPADITLASSSDDGELSSLEDEISFGDEMGNGSNKAKKVDGQKQSWWRSLLSPEAYLKARKRMGTDRPGGDPSSRREDDLQEAVQERQLMGQYLTYDPSTQGVKTVLAPER